MITSSLSHAVLLQTLMGTFCCCLLIWCSYIQYKLTEIQHNLANKEFKKSSQLTELRSLQKLNGESLKYLESRLNDMERTSKNVVQTVEKQKNLLLTTVEKQHQMHRDIIRYSEDLLNLHTLYAEHYTYPQSYVDKAKDELKHQFDVEKGKIFERLYEEKLSRWYEVLRANLTVPDNVRAVKCKSHEHILSELHLNKKILKQTTNDLKMAVNRWMDTSRSAISSLQRLILQQAYEIADVKLWTARYITQKFTSNQKFSYAAKKQYNRLKAKMMALNDTVNIMKKSCCSYMSFAYRSGKTTKSKCSRILRKQEISRHVSYPWRGVLDTLMIFLLLSSMIYLLWSNYLSIRKMIVKTLMKEKSKPLQTENTSKDKLENSLCVVGFGTGLGSQKYVQLACELLGSGCSLQMKKVMVNDVFNLQTIPPSKMAVVFVDYNERNLIIEEEKEGLKRQTLSMLESTGAVVIVVYCWELSSKHLDEGRLFAQKLTVVDRMKELRELREKDSVFSIYDKFSQTQKEVFRSKLNDIEKQDN